MPYDGYEKEFKNFLSSGYEKCDDQKARELKRLKGIGTFELNDLDGYSFKEAVNIVIDAFLYDVISVEEGQPSPYQYGFYIKYKDEFFYPSGDPVSMAESLVSRIQINACADHSPFKNYKEIVDYSKIHISELKTEVEKKKQLISETVKIPTPKVPLVPSWESYRNLVSGKTLYAKVPDCTWMQALPAFYGYCLDYVHDHNDFPYRKEIIEYHAYHGLDIENNVMLEKWCLEHPVLCYDRDFWTKEVEKGNDDSLESEDENDFSM